MGLFSRRTPDFSTRAGNERAARIATKAAEKARREGDTEAAARAESFAAEARRQAQYHER